MNNYGIIHTRYDNGLLLVRLSEVYESPHNIEYYCKIGKVILNNNPSFEINENSEKWRGLGFTEWQDHLFVNKNFIFEFPDDESALLYVEVM